MQSILAVRSRASSRAVAITTRHITRTHTSHTSDQHIKPLESILIANRGEIALRVGRTAADYGIQTTTIYTDVDRNAQHALSSPFAINLGSTDQYLNGPKIINVAKEQGCQAIHPGYGFLSENADFAKQCVEAGLIFIGPPWKAILSMGDKARSKEIMLANGVPCIPGYHGANQDPQYLAQQADDIGYPVLLKAVRGGGGKGMRIAQTPEQFYDQLSSAKSEAKSSFGDDEMLVEKYITTPRHIEVQVFADRHGNCVALGERDCSIQRRHQKILEESPAPNLAEDIRQDLWDKARKAALAVNYEGAGTVEFIFDNDTGEFFFMEMNTRLQVEHPVTEMITGLDLVHWQIMVAEGRPLPSDQDEVHERIKARGHAIEARIYAEDPSMNFMPSTGTLYHLRTPQATDSVRIDAGFVQGDEVSSHYDPMIAKLIVSASDRALALQKLERALEQYEIAGVTTNIEFLRRCARSADFVKGVVETGYIPKHADELFAEASTPIEVNIQAAIAICEIKNLMPHSGDDLLNVGFNHIGARRDFYLVNTAAKDKKALKVEVEQTASNRVNITVPELNYTSLEVMFTWDGKSHALTTSFSNKRMETTVVPIPIDSTLPTISEEYVLFQHGNQYRIALVNPPWMASALGEKDVANSVLSPMPCKIFKVHVKPGDIVRKGQALLVIESMKMETTIRAPIDGVVKRVHKQPGAVVKAGISLVEFEDDT